MTYHVRKAMLLGATALALLAGPVLVSQTAVSDLAAYAKDGNGNGGGGGNGNGGNGNGGGGGSSSDHGDGGGSSGERGNSSSHGNSGNSHKQSQSSEHKGGQKGASNKSNKSASSKDGSSKGVSSKGNKGVSGKGKKPVDTVTLASKGTDKATKTKNLNAQLAGLNSLNRNINGLMNSSDKRMEGVRAYVIASAELETAKAALTDAETALDGLQDSFDTYVADYIGTAGLTAYDGTDVYSDPTLESLNDRLAALDEAIAADPANQAALDEEEALVAALEAINASPELAALNGQQEVIDGLEADVADHEAQTTEDVLRTALLAAANKNRVAEAGGDAYLTPEIMDWATNVLGVGEADGLIDDYLAR